MPQCLFAVNRFQVVDHFVFPPDAIASVLPATGALQLEAKQRQQLRHEGAHRAAGRIEAKQLV